jgi:hypothetical protein
LKPEAASIFFKIASAPRGSVIPDSGRYVHKNHATVGSQTGKSRQWPILTGDVHELADDACQEPVGSDQEPVTTATERTLALPKFVILPTMPARAESLSTVAFHGDLHKPHTLAVVQKLR